MKNLNYLSLLVPYFVFMTGPFSQAQTTAQNMYVSSIDQDLAIKSLVLVPVSDNIGGIYAKPLYEELVHVLNEDKQWSLSNYPNEYKLKPEGLDDRPAEVQKLLRVSRAEAAIATKIIRGTKGTSITMTLFVGRDGLPFLQEELKDFQGFELSELKLEIRKLFENLKFRMPFRSTILSRRGQEVTLNLGRAYGLKPESRVSVVQIIKVNRHPKHHFMVSTEKEVLGRVKLFKVDDYMSFGFIEMEKEPGVISVGSKVMPDEFVKYSLPVTAPSGRVLHEINISPEKEFAFGEDPKEWVPNLPPQFGKLDLLAGLSSYTQNANLTTAGSISGSSSLAPNIMARGELWLSPEVFLGTQLRQSVFSVDNSLSGSTPSSLNMSMGQYGVNAGYNLLLTNDFFGPKLQFGAGYLNTNFNVDDSSPTAFTSMRYGGLFVRLAGCFPLSEVLPLEFGGKLDYFINSSLSENVTSGASSSNNLSNFSFYGKYKKKTREYIFGEILFEGYSSNFSGIGQRLDPATSSSHKMTSLFLGMQYLF